MSIIHDGWKKDRIGSEHAAKSNGPGKDEEWFSVMGEKDTQGR